MCMMNMTGMTRIRPDQQSPFSRLHNRLGGLAAVVGKKLDEADDPGRPMSKREQEDLKYILSRIEQMLMDDAKETEGEMPVKYSRQYLNTQCEFFDLDANRIQCAIGCDMFHCSKRCAYATNVYGSMPPYCTKYMKGRL